MKPIAVGDIVFPYSKSLALQTFKKENPDVFIRARYHEQLNIWYSISCLEGNENPTLPESSDKSGGLIVFLQRVPKAGEGVRISKVAASGSSARGTIIDIQNVRYQSPFEFETITNNKIEE
jgi:hypothetical protein